MEIADVPVAGSQAHVSQLANTLKNGTFMFKQDTVYTFLVKKNSTKIIV